MSLALFEVSWEVAHRVGGLHTVLVSKAPSLTARHGDDYVAVGPLLGEDQPANPAFEEEAGFDDFRDACRDAGVEARVGRWRVPGRPRTILVGFAGLYPEKDALLASLWERFAVDSLHGGWDYVEPVLFAHAAGIAIDRWWHEYVAPQRKPAVAQFHNWQTAAGLLVLKEELPAIGTIFTTHATVLGRTLAASGQSPLDLATSESPTDLAALHDVRSKHSLEGAGVREADVFTSVSTLTAEEARRFHGREAQPLLPNGLDLELLDQSAGLGEIEGIRQRLRHIAWAVTGEEVDDPFLVVLSARYDVHTKGVDILLKAAARLNAEPGRPVLVFLFVPAETTGVRWDVRERLQHGDGASLPPLGLSTHDFVESSSESIARLAGELGLDNRHGSRVQVIHVGALPAADDGFFDLPPEAVLRAVDLGCYPAFYEPWGTMPAECLAVGVPTVTSDLAGFGLWVKEQGLDAEDGVHVLARRGRGEDDVVDDLVGMLETRAGTSPDQEHLRTVCRRAAGNLTWADLIQHYEEAFAAAAEAAGRRRAVPPLDPHRRPVPLTPRPPRESERPHLVAFRVRSRIPEALQDLPRLAENLWWTWHPEAGALFREADPDTFEAVGGNPIAMLARIRPARLEALATDASFRARLGDVAARMDAYLASAAATLDLGGGGVVDRDNPVAYFCFEYALHPSLHGYAGGLGVLAGDHLKSASDVNLPFVAVGLFYRGGYAEQEVGPNGEPTSQEVDDDPTLLPLTLVRDKDGEPVRVTVGLPDRRVVLQAWRVDVGRVPLYLLDSDVGDNRTDDRRLTRRLYGGGRELRLDQEVLLGKGGMRLLARLGLEPAVLHLNEGHAGFAPLERVAHLVRERGLAPDEASAFVRATTAFTTHTPVPAGHDVFDEDLVRRYFGQASSRTGLGWERFLALGRAPGEAGGFNMTYFSMSFASWINGVSQKHGEVSRDLLHAFWPGLLRAELPLHAITNGVHLPTWTSPEMQRLLGAADRKLEGSDFERAEGIDPRALFGARESAKARLVEDLGRRLRRSGRRRGDAPRRLALLEERLVPEALYLVFARRFSPYKRPGLLLRERERLVRLLSDDARPVRLVYAGKAHPRDAHGQEIVREVAQASQAPDLYGRLLFVPNYDLSLAARLVEGADVWINHPVPPLEASGTSGMKVAANGGLNLSVLDGWWIEGWDGRNGWGVEGDHAGLDAAFRDDLDAATILSLLEDEVVPAFFDRGDDGLPHAWLARVGHSLRTLPPFFSTDRMVGEYASRAYAPLALSYRRLSAARFATGRALAARHRELRAAMEGVRVHATRIGDLAQAGVGDFVEAEVDLALGELSPADVVVELVLGLEDGTSLPRFDVHRLDARGVVDDGLHRYEGRAPLEEPGPWVYGLRVRPREVAPWDLMLHRLVRWA